MNRERVADELAKWIMGRSFGERLLRTVCSSRTLMKWTKLGAIAWSVPRVVPRSTIRISEFDGYRFYTDICEYNGASYYFFKRPGVYPLLRTGLVKPGSICFDIGANMGSYSFWMAAQVGPTGEVHAFEPQPDKFVLLQKSVALNQFESRLFLDSHCVYSDSGSELTLFLSSYHQNSGLASVIKDADDVHRGKSTLRVKTLRLADYCERHSISHIDLVKIDVENAEIHVLRGMGGLLIENKIDLLVVELCSGQEAHKHLESHGYRGWLLNETTAALPIDEVEEGIIGDFLFVSPKLDCSFLERKV